MTTRALTIVFTDVTAPSPGSLSYPDTGDPNEQGVPVATYEFEVRSKGKDDTSFRRLNVIPGVNEKPQPTVYVGNVQDGIGEATIYVNGKKDEDVYEKETEQEFRIVFKALGPMYDIDRETDPLNTLIQITVPAGLVDADRPIQMDDNSKANYVQYSGKTGTVVYEDSNDAAYN